MEYLPNFQVHRPGTAEEAVKLRVANVDARFLAGGTDMIVNVRRGIERPSDLIDLTHIGELTEIREEAEGIRVGAAVTFHQLPDDDTCRTSYPATLATRTRLKPGCGNGRGPRRNRRRSGWCLPVTFYISWSGQKRLGLACVS